MTPRRFSFTGHIDHENLTEIVTRLSAAGLTVVATDLGRGKWRIYGFSEGADALHKVAGKTG